MMSSYDLICFIKGLLMQLCIGYAILSLMHLHSVRFEEILCVCILDA